MIDTLFVITLVEAFIGGGGRLVEIGPFTLRMLLFASCLIIGTFALYLRLRRMDGQRLAFGLVLFYLLVHLFGLLVGTMNGADTGDMMAEFQQSLYWLIAPFFAFVLQSTKMVNVASLVVRFSGLFLALGYFVILALLVIGKLSIIQILPLLHDSGEVVIRADHFLFYKGFLYLGISIVFFVAIRGRYWVFLTGIVSVALVLTLTRGFLLSTSVAVLMMLAAQGRRIVAAVAVVMVIAAAFVVLIYVPSLDESFTESRSASNDQRAQDFFGIVDNLTPTTALIGEGFGAEVDDRQFIENTLLWAFWKLGVIGAVFWTLPLCLCAYFYLKIPDRMHHRSAGAFFFGTILVYVETLTNPYLNNPIGLSYVLVALFSLRTLARDAQRPRTDKRDDSGASDGTPLLVR
jgi:hypothetical protein